MYEVFQFTVCALAVIGALALAIVATAFIEDHLGGEPESHTSLGDG